MEQLMSITSIASESSDFMNNCPAFMPANCSTKFSIDPGFIERAARHTSFSFGSCREAQADNLESDKLSRVPSSQSLKSKENSSLTDLGLSSRKKHNVQKRKAEPKNKAKLAEESSLSAKKYRPTETSDKKVCFDLKEGINKGSELAEPPKDYIHVRARSGQATDSHSLAERVRRERISQRMKLLQDLVPGCNKITGKALMLDEIINYVQSLQRQVELLSMKLATFKPQFDDSLANFMSKEFHPLMSQTKASILCSVYPLDNSSVNSPCYQSKEGKAFPKGMETRSFLSLADDTLYQTTSCMQPTSLDVFGAAGSQVGNICDYDLHGIAQMNLMLNQEIGFNYQTFMQDN